MLTNATDKTPVPLWLPQKGFLSRLFLPRPATLPKGPPRLLDFGPNAYPVLAAVPHPGTADVTFNFQEPFALLWIAANEIISNASAPLGFNMQMTHVRGGVRLSVFNKDVNNRLCTGTGQNPMLLRSLDLFDVNDQLNLEIKTLAKDALTSRIEIVLQGVNVGG